MNKLTKKIKQDKKMFKWGSQIIGPRKEQSLVTLIQFKSELKKGLDTSHSPIKAGTPFSTYFPGSGNKKPKSCKELARLIR